MKKTFGIILLHSKESNEGYIIGLSITNESVRVKKGNLVYQIGLAEKLFRKQHLYIISDDVIKEGDWYSLTKDIMRQCKSDKEALQVKGKGAKIVATTDKSLTTRIYPHSGGGIEDVCYIPNLPESFIKDYIKAYNEGKPITEVDLEMKMDFVGYFEGTRMENWDKVIKTRTDNTVIITLKN